MPRPLRLAACALPVPSIPAASIAWCACLGLCLTLAAPRAADAQTPSVRTNGAASRTPLFAGVDPFGSGPERGEGNELFNEEHDREAAGLWPVAGTAGYLFGHNRQLGDFKGMTMSLWGQPLGLWDRALYFGGRFAAMVYEDDPSKKAWVAEGYQTREKTSGFEVSKDGDRLDAPNDYRLEFEGLAGLQVHRRNVTVFMEGTALVSDVGVPIKSGKLGSLGINVGASLVLAHLIGLTAQVGVSQRDGYRVVLGAHLEGPMTGLSALVGSFLPLVLLVR